jgi:hypothetical protein
MLTDRPMHRVDAYEHPFTYPIDTYGCRNIDRDIEEEANWLGPTLLICDEAALHIVKSGMSTDAARRTYRVSEPVLRMRINASGAPAYQPFRRRRRRPEPGAVP